MASSRLTTAPSAAGRWRSESMSNEIKLRKNVLEICDKCGKCQVISAFEINMANVDPFWGKCPNCGASTRKVYDGNTGSEIDRIEHAIKYGMRKIAYRNFRAFQSFVTKDKECVYSEYFTYASKLPKSQRFGKSSMILSQVLNLMKYKDNIDMFKPLKFNPLLVEI